MLTKRDLLRSAALAAIAVTTTKAVPASAQAKAEWPDILEAKAIYTFDNGGGAFATPGNYGTVTLTQAGADVSFNIVLAANYNFVNIADSAQFRSLGESVSINNHGTVAFTAISVAGDRIGVFTGAGGPIPSGTSRTYTIETSGQFNRLSVISMLVNTNDAFTGLDSARLSGRGFDVSTMAYDRPAAPSPLSTTRTAASPAVARSSRLPR